MVELRNKPLWEPCEDCEEYYCNLHESHAFECGCPDVDELSGNNINPYAAGSLKEFLEMSNQSQ